MTKSESDYISLAKIIKNGDESLIVEAVESLRNTTPFRGAIKLLADFYNSTENDNIKMSIERFLNDLKDTSVREEIITALKTDYKPDTIRVIASSCWQSGIDYSGYIEEFAKLFTISPFSIALECSTIIEELLPIVEPIKRKKISSIISSTKNKEISGLSTELVNLIDG